jgi:hypothetical protein
MWAEIIQISIPIIIILGILLRIKLRGYFWKAKTGEELEFKEFMSRWAKGLDGITPLQQTKTMLWGFAIILIGLIWGALATFLTRMWWAFLLIWGSLPITAMQLVSTIQRYNAQKRTEQIMEELENEP